MNHELVCLAKGELRTCSKHCSRTIRLFILKPRYAVASEEYPRRDEHSQSDSLTCHCEESRFYRLVRSQESCMDILLPSNSEWSLHVIIDLPALAFVRAAVSITMKKVGSVRKSANGPSTSETKSDALEFLLPNGCHQTACTLT